MFFCLFCIFFLIVSPSLIFNRNVYFKNINEYLSLTHKKQVVLNVWHVETFEGGIKSRKKFLEEVGIKFNKINPNVFVSVVNLTEEQLFLNLQNNNNNFDLISFGIGSGCLLPSFLQPLEKNNNLKPTLQNYSTINNSILAYPYMISGYVAISKNNNEINLQEKLQGNYGNSFNLGFATADYINPAKVLNFQNLTRLNKEHFYSCSSSYNAYQNFVANKFTTLIGTMRDYYRCKNREEIGKMQTCSYQFLGEYTDLIQYMGVNNNIEEYKTDAAKNFLNYLLERKAQEKLKDYGLFPAINITIYEDAFLHEVEESFLNEMKTINVFTKIEDIEHNKQESMENLFS